MTAHAQGASVLSRADLPPELGREPNPAWLGPTQATAHRLQFHVLAGMAAQTVDGRGSAEHVHSVPRDLSVDVAGRNLQVIS